MLAAPRGVQGHGAAASRVPHLGVAQPAPWRRATTSSARSARCRASSGDEPQPVRDAPDPSPGELLGQLVDTNPNRLAVSALDGFPFAWQKGTLFVADPPTTAKWMPQEWQRGTVTGWPASISQLLGYEALAVTRSAEQHGALRRVFEVMRSDAQVKRMLPGIQATAQRYLSEWSTRGTVLGFVEMLTLVFDVIINQALQLGWSDADVRQWAQVFEVWNQGFTVFANPLPWSKFKKGMAARQQLIARFRESLRGELVPGSIPAVLVEKYGAESDIITDNLIMVIFAGFETSAVLATKLLWHLARDPAALEKLRAEQAAVAKAHGGALTLEAIAAMPYSRGALEEVLRLSQIVASVPRVAQRELDLGPRGPVVPSGCPLSVSWGGMSLRDPAVQGSEREFKPERWAKGVSEYQWPFGEGQHDCVGQRVARSIALAVAQELALRYSLSAEADEKMSDFPTGGRPRNDLPLTLTPL